MKRAAMIAMFTMVAVGCGGSSTGGSGSSPDLNSMIGMRASSLDTEMADYGYRNAGGYKEMEVSYTTWWNAARSHCVLVATIDGRVATLETVPSTECQ
jgi:hypothetical protein